MGARRVVGLVVVLFAAVAPAGCATKATPAAAPHTSVHPVVRQATVQETAVAFHADGTPAVHVVATVSGSCFATTVAAAPSAAGYRCISSGNVLLDPCVAPPGPANPADLLCLPDPWSGATLLHLTAALPAPQPLRNVTRPWAIVLAGNVRCLAVSGTVSSAHGVDLAYTCAGGGGAAQPTVGADGVWHAERVTAAGTVQPAAVVTQVWHI